MGKKINAFLSRKKNRQVPALPAGHSYLSPILQKAVDQIEQQLVREGIELKPSIQAHVELLALLKLQRAHNPFIHQFAKTAPVKHVDLLVSQYRRFLESLEV